MAATDISASIMDLDSFQTDERIAENGRQMYDLMTELFPICRSLTGAGVAKTLDILKRRIPLTVREVPSGTQVFDWTVPREWNIRDACVKNSLGERVVDFARSNLHVVGYSVPVRQKMSLAELRPHLHSLPAHPDWIPFLASYYHDTWGFCITQRQLDRLEEDQYEVIVDSTLENGLLRFGELLLEGEIEDEILLTSYLCHPSLCNDNLSGVVLLTALAEALGSVRRRHTYRFLFLPETIGAIAWLCLNEPETARIKAGLVLTCVGDSGNMTYQRSRRGDAWIDRAAEKVFQDSGRPYRIMDFVPTGSDLRQFCSPGFNLPMGSLMRTPYEEFPEYHTSADNLDFVQPAWLADSFSKCMSLIGVLEGDRIYVSQNPKCEPQLGRRGLYPKLTAEKNDMKAPMMWVLNMSDGTHSLLEIARRSGLPFPAVRAAADRLVQCQLLKEAPEK